MRRVRETIQRSAFAFAIGVLAHATAGATEVELGLITGLQQTGSVGTNQGTLDLAAGFLYGLSVGWRVRPDGIVEIAWSRQDSEATGNLTSGPQEFDVTIDTLEFGGLWETRPGRMRPFLGMTLGGTRLAGPGQDYGEAWNFSGSISGGIRYFLSDHALLRLEGRGSGILLSGGGALACGFPPGGCQVAVTGSFVGAFSARVSIAATF
jgi:hypothetical protein